jgi:hypothetical protein
MWRTILLEKSPIPELHNRFSLCPVTADLPAMLSSMLPVPECDSQRRWKTLTGNGRSGGWEIAALRIDDSQDFTYELLGSASVFSYHALVNQQPENLLDGSAERFPEAIFKNYAAPESQEAPALKPK